MATCSYYYFSVFETNPQETLNVNSWLAAKFTWQKWRFLKHVDLCLNINDLHNYIFKTDMYVLHLLMHAWTSVIKLCAIHVSAVNARTLFWNQKFHISHQISHRQTQFPTVYWHLSRCESVSCMNSQWIYAWVHFPIMCKIMLTIFFYWAKATNQKKQLSNCLLGWMLRMLSGFAAQHQH